MASKGGEEDSSRRDDLRVCVSPERRSACALNCLIESIPPDELEQPVLPREFHGENQPPRNDAPRGTIPLVLPRA